MKKINIALAILLFSTFSLTPLQASYWGKLLKDYKMVAKNHSYCYINDKDEIVGENKNMKVRLASVSKLITSLWAIEKLGAAYEYPTKFYFNGKKLHIVGSLDPVYSIRKLFFLVNQLNNIGIKQLDEVTFDKQTRFNSKAEKYEGTYIEIPQTQTAKHIRDYFHTPGWNKLKTAYKQFIKDTPKSLLKELQITEKFENLSLKVKKVYPQQKNNLGGLEDTEGYIHLSPTIDVYLKYMNIVSNNYVADQIYRKLGGEKEFDKYINKTISEIFPTFSQERKGYKTNEPSMKFYTGSGLNTKRKGKRVDNYGSCSLIVRLIQRLNSKITEANKTIQKFVAVPGVDRGSFRNRLRSSRFAKTLVAKTGSLMHTSALAGKINTKKGDIYFGVFHQLRGWKGSAKTVQNKMMENIWEKYTGKKFKYKAKFFFPASKPLAPIKAE
jgi:serine-type D-Ala-D-Ala carboxypeptidase/endopeptidase (penicillin-binding protein 4)